jgi:nucleoside-diphosphate-sugar epimerase
MVALGFSTASPAAFKPSHSTSRRFVHVADLADALLRPFQRGDGRHLDGGEHAVIEIGLHPRQRGDQVGLPHMKPTRQPGML